MSSSGAAGIKGIIAKREGAKSMHVNCAAPRHLVSYRMAGSYASPGAVNFNAPTDEAM